MIKEIKIIIFWVTFPILMFIIGFMIGKYLF